MESINRPPLKLIFGTPEFLPEDVVQSTVRVGQKWCDDLKGKVAPRIPCVDLNGTVLGTATVVGSLSGLFRDFGYIGSMVNHQENCRDIDGLVYVLSECYPDFNPESSQVTVIFFKFAPIIPIAAVVAVGEKAEELSDAVSDDDSGNDDPSPTEPEKGSEAVVTEDTAKSDEVTADDDAPVQIPGITEANLLDKTSGDSEKREASDADDSNGNTALDG